MPSLLFKRLIKQSRSTTAHAAATPPPIGLLAGAGRFPIHFARAARRQGLSICCVAVRDMAEPSLVDEVDTFYWTGLGKMGRVFRLFRRAGVREWVMAGKVHKVNLLDPRRLWNLLPDWRALKFWYARQRRDNRDDTLLLSLIDEFLAEGMICRSALDFCPELLVTEGILTRRKPTATELRDVEFGWEIAREMGRLDIGQSVAVRERAVLAVEAIEGTDKAILRAGELCRRSGFVVVKVAKPQQDMRFDVPTIGTATIETMRQAGARVLAIEAGRTILLDQPEVVALADRYGIAIIACRHPASVAA
jgi:DUF1009 family protein